jgi:excinuclease ABC subunit C
VYRWHGPGDELLYVGKSVRVRTRLLSYFRAERGDKAAEMVREAARVSWEYVGDEFGALVREMKLIQRHRPRYNVQHKRKRSYAFVKVTGDVAPRIVPTSRVVDDGSTYYGPFPRVGAVGETIRDLAYVLGLRDCPAGTPIFFDDQLEIFGESDAWGARRPPRCLRADLGTCLAPCCGRVGAAEYRKRVRQGRRFLEGRTSAPVERLRERMEAAAAAMEFEYAAILRDRLERLDRFQEELAAFQGTVESLSFVYRAPGHGSRDRLYLIRRGRIRAEASPPRSRRERSRVEALVRGVFSGVDPGPARLTAEEASEILLVARWFRLNAGELKRTTAPEAWLGGA